MNMLLVTAELLEARGMCEDPVQKFQEAHPRGIDITALWSDNEEYVDQAWNQLLAEFGPHIGWAIAAGILPAAIWADLRQADLHHVNLTGADLRQASFHEANLAEAILRRVNAVQGDFLNADMCHADLRGANLRNAVLTRANLYRADLRQADLSGASLDAATLTGAHLADVNWTDATWDEDTIWPQDFKGRALLQNLI